MAPRIDPPSILRGNLAPGGAVAKITGKEGLGFTGKARAFDTEDAFVAAVESGNTGSIVMHKRLDFLQVGRMPQVGAKFDRWLDLTLLQLVLDERPFPDDLP